MNEVSQIYLGTYSRIDSIDNLIKNFWMKYICCTFWHSPMIYAMSLAVVVAYDMYLEVEKEELN